MASGVGSRMTNIQISNADVTLVTQLQDFLLPDIYSNAAMTLFLYALF